MFSARLINHNDTLMLNICDADLLGRTLKRDNFTLKISEKCYAEKVVDSRFELPLVDVMWEGQKTYLRNFAEYPKIMRRDPTKLLQYLSKEFAVPAERVGDSAMFVGKGILMILNGCLKFMSVITLNVLLAKALIQE